MAKKSFKNNPALQFISIDKDEEVEVNKEKISYSNKEQKSYDKEVKSKRFPLTMKPSLYIELSKIASIQRMSVNSCINMVLDEYIKSHIHYIEKYDSVFGEE